MDVESRAAAASQVTRMIRKLFLISLLANLGLIAAVAYRWSHRPAVISVTPEENTAVAETSALATKSPGVTVSYVTNETRAEFSWALIETPDYKKYIASLRAVGCPEETIRDIIIADVNKNYARRGMALQREQRAKQKYWENDQNNHSGNPNSPWRQMQVWEKEKRALLKELLGPDILDEMEKNQMAMYGNWGGYYAAGKEWGFLPANKRDQARDLTEKFQQLQQEIYYKSKGDYGDETQAQLRALQKQKTAEMASILSPQEFEDYDLRQSQTAQNMRWQFKYFKASEEEYRKIFKLQKTFDEQYAGYNPDPDDREAQKKLQEASTALREGQKAALGDRGAAYARSQDYEYQELARLAGNAGLAPEAADKVYDIKQAVQDEQTKLNSSKELTPEQRSAALKQIKSDAEKAVTQILGEKNYSKYRNRGAYWLNE